MKRIKNGWQRRTAREKRLLTFAGIGLGLLLLFNAWQQLDQWRDRQRLAFEQQRRAIGAFIAQESDLPPPVQSLTLAALNQRASEHGLTLALEAVPNGYRLTAARPVAFQPLMAWLTQLESCCALFARQMVYAREGEQRILVELELTHDR